MTPSVLPDVDVPEFTSNDVLTPHVLNEIHGRLGITEWGRPKRVISDVRSKGEQSTHKPREVKAAMEIVLMEDVMERLERWRASVPHGLAVFPNDEARAMRPLNEAEWRSMNVKSQQWSIPKITEVIAGTVAAALFGVTQQSIDALRQTSPQFIEGLGTMTMMCNEGTARPQHFGTNMNGAIGNAVGTTMRMLEVLPRAFSRQLSRSPTPEEATTVARASAYLPELLASSAFDVFVALHDMLRIRRGSGRQGQLFDTKNFCLRRREGDVVLAIPTRAVEGVTLPREKREIRIGCSALLAQGRDGRNLVRVLYDWCCDLAERFTYPRLSHSHAPPHLDRPRSRS